MVHHTVGNKVSFTLTGKLTNAKLIAYRKTVDTKMRDQLGQRRKPRPKYERLLSHRLTAVTASTDRICSNNARRCKSSYVEFVTGLEQTASV